MGINVGAFKNVVTKLGTFTNSNATVILGVAACIGVVGVAVSAVKAQKKADDIIKREEDDRIRDNIEDHTPLKEITVQERFQMTWKCYIPTAILGVGTIACIASGTTIGVRRLAAATLAYEAANGKLNDVKSELEKLMGSEGKGIFETATADKCDPPVTKVALDQRPETKFWVVDPFGRRWITDELTLLQAQNELNDIVESGDADLNDWYQINGLEPMTMGGYFIWGKEDWTADSPSRLHLNFDHAVMIEGVPHVYIEYGFGEKQYMYAASRDI